MHCYIYGDIVNTCISGAPNQEKQDRDGNDAHIQLVILLDWDWLAVWTVSIRQEITSFINTQNI